MYCTVWLCPLAIRLWRVTVIVRTGQLFLKIMEIGEKIESYKKVYTIFSKENYELTIEQEREIQRQNIIEFINNDLNMSNTISSE